jgi:hypothetical protein
MCVNASVHQQTAPRSRSLGRSRVSAQDIQQHTSMMEGLPAVISLHDADHLRRGAIGVLQSSDTQACLQPEGDFRMRICELLLHELERRERSVELVPLERIFPGLRETRLERAHHTPGDPVARTVEAGESGTESDRTGHQGIQ